MKILITGHKGFIGKYLWSLLEQDKENELVGYDRGDKLPTTDVDLIYHLAANANAYESVQNPKLAMENIETTFNLLEWMRNGTTRKMIYTSSREVYSLVNPYGASKLASELLIQPYCMTYGFGAISVRLSNIYGKGNYPHRFIESTIEKAKKSEDIEIYGFGKTLNFVHVDDCVKELAGLPQYLELGKHIITDIASVNSWKLSEVARLIIELTESKSQLVQELNRPGETMHYIPRQVKYPVLTSLKEGIKRCLN